jgi:predicted TIM-barrel fold metal-dependent hydrolase
VTIDLNQSCTRLPRSSHAGGDWPFAAFEDSMRYEHAISSFRQWVPDANMRRIISGETAFRLYFA